MKLELDEFKFDSDFDSGNLEKIELVENELVDGVVQKTFQLWTRPDGFNNPTKNRTWFYFNLFYTPNNQEQSVTIVLKFMNLNRVQKLFNMGLRPVYREIRGSPWSKIHCQPVTQLSNHGMEMQFTFCFSPKATSPFKGTLKSPAAPGGYSFAYCTNDFFLQGYYPRFGIRTDWLFSRSFVETIQKVFNEQRTKGIKQGNANQSKSNYQRHIRTIPADL